MILSFFAMQFCFGQHPFYSKAYGDSTNRAVIFLHGGPGYNAVSFEFSTAQKLAGLGFYVIVYDQRGCGRTRADTGSRFTFQEAFDDLNGIYKKYNITTATLIGHSFGGTLGILYSKTFPGKISSLVLVSSPLSYQQMFRTIISKCRKTFSESKSQQLQYIEALEKIDTASLEYSSYCFLYAMSGGFYKTKNPTRESQEINDSLKKCANVSLLSNMTQKPVNGFYKNEHYTTLDLSAALAEVSKNTRVYGIYGQEDGLFDEQHLAKLKSAIGEDNFTLVKGSSHNVFIDQQAIFLDLVRKVAGKK